MEVKCSNKGHQRILPFLACHTLPTHTHALSLSYSPHLQSPPLHNKGRTLIYTDTLTYTVSQHSHVPTYLPTYLLSLSRAHSIANSPITPRLLIFRANAIVSVAPGWTFDALAAHELETIYLPVSSAGTPGVLKAVLVFYFIFSLWTTDRTLRQCHLLATIYSDLRFL